MFCRHNLSLMRGYSNLTKEALIIWFHETQYRADALARNDINNGQFVLQHLPKCEYRIPEFRTSDDDSETEVSEKWPIYCLSNKYGFFSCYFCVCFI